MLSSGQRFSLPTGEHKYIQIVFCSCCHLVVKRTKSGFHVIMHLSTIHGDIVEDVCLVLCCVSVNETPGDSNVFESLNHKRSKKKTGGRYYLF